MEHVLIHLPIRAAQTAVELPVREVPRIDETHSVRPDLGEQLHDGAGAGELDLADGDSAGGVEFGSLALESVEGVETEELVHQSLRLRVELAVEFGGLDGLVEVLDHQVLGVRLTEAVEVDEKIVPRFLLLITVLKRLEGEERSTPGECSNDVLVLAEHIECCAHVGLVEEGLEDGGGVVGRLVTVENAASRLQEVTRDLLGDHVVVALPSHGGKVIRVPPSNAGEVTVSMTTACTAAHLQTFSCSGTGQRLQAARCGVEISKQVTAGVCLLGTSTALCAAHLPNILVHPLLVLRVQCHHTLAGEMESESGSQQCQDTDLHHCVVEDLSLAALLVRRILVLELSPDGTISCSNGDTTCEGATGLHDNVASDPCQGTVDQGGSLGTNVFAGVGVDLGEPREHVDVGDLDLVEEQETIVHGAVSGRRQWLPFRVTARVSAGMLTCSRTWVRYRRCGCSEAAGAS